MTSQALFPFWGGGVWLFGVGLCWGKWQKVEEYRNGGVKEWLEGGWYEDRRLGGAMCEVRVWE
ncbi:hypothetical protein R70331_03535 [Paenibacillus sp. FSL R7-0331]|nr:hypothetical protein R70331_03535 [Paenibacillus sp. FSL R7-0331]